MTFANASADQSEEGRAFLQRRVGGAGLAGAAGFGAFLAFRAATVVVDGHGHAVLDPSMLWHGVAALALLATWGVSRGRPLSARLIRATETVGLLIATFATVAMGQSLNLWERPEMIVHSALTFGWTARAIYVPSSARRTLLVTTLAGLPMLVGVYVSALRFRPQLWASIDPNLAQMTPADVAQALTLSVAVWWVLTVGLCTAASRVIYGLRREVRQAQKLGQYTLESKLGEGGMGMVYRASHALLRRPTAIKLLRPDKIGEEGIARFEREVQMTSQLSHHNTVRIYDYGRTPDGTFYYAMELLGGATLEVLVEADGPQPPGRVLHILKQVVGALREAHSIGLIHRDIKPSNIILCELGGLSDVAKVVDFGLVKDLEAMPEDAALTQADAVAGTPLYMPPEAVTTPQDQDARADLYAVGAVAYYLLTGSHVFTGNTIVEVCSKHVHVAPERPSKRLGRPLPQALEDLVLACLEKDRNRRPRNADDLLTRLEHCALEEPWSEHSARTWWGKHQDALQQSGRGQSLASIQTELAVDLTARAG